MASGLRENFVVGPWLGRRLLADRKLLNFGGGITSLALIVHASVVRVHSSLTQVVRQINLRALESRRALSYCRLPLVI